MLSGKSDSGFYVRYRARITGPHATDELARMVRRGTLSRAHEISRDRVQWTSAGSVPGLFDSHQPSHAGVEIALPAAVTAGVGGMFYRDGETSVGPVPMATIESMAHGGTILPGTIVWAAGDTNSYPASAHPLLTHLAWSSGGDRRQRR